MKGGDGLTQYVIILLDVFPALIVLDPQTAIMTTKVCVCGSQIDK